MAHAVPLGAAARQRRADHRDLLAWASTPAAANALDRINPECHEHVGAHLSVEAGPAASLLLRLAADGCGGGALPLGLVLDAL